MADDAWRLTQTGLDRARNVYFETVFSQANGYMGVRGYTEEPLVGTASAREAYLAGVFSDVDEQAARIIGTFPWPVLQMVSLPELFAARLALAGEPFDPAAGEVLEWSRTLDLRTAVLRRSVRWRSPAGRTSRSQFERFLSAAQPHLACQRITVTPEGWTGQVVAAFPLDARVASMFRCGDRRQPHLPQYHYEHHDVRADGALGRIGMSTHRTAWRVAVATLVGPDGTTEPEGPAALRQRVSRAVDGGQPFVCERFVAVASSRDEDVGPDPSAAAEDIARSGAERGFDAALADSRQVWTRRWSRADIELAGAPRDQKVLRYNLFQLMQMAPFHTDRISIPARGLSWNRYRGLYFWDTEIFLLPFYQWTFPEVARNLLAFRHRTLGGARGNAEHWGGCGALYPWMTDSDTGLDNSIDARVWKLVHQTADVAYAVDQYAVAAGDVDFVASRGLEVLAETARQFASRLFRGEDGAWHLDHTIGPDEDGDPGRDNGFTLLMARRNLRAASRWFRRLADERPEAVAALADRIGLTEREVRRWGRLADEMLIPCVPGTDIPLQDEYLLNKKPADVVAWRLREDPEHWQIDPKTAKQYRLIKQSDIVLATFLLGDEFTPEQVAATYDFYEPMTQHRSSLSWNTHAIVAARLGRRQQAYEYYLKSAGLDLDDVKHATEDGLHAAALGGCWQAVVLGMAGLCVRDGRLACDPQLPPSWRSMRFSACYRGRCYGIEARQDGSWDIEERSGEVPPEPPSP
jgi:trehalose/maltose hydrolase-like predicted phosphorylase